MKTFQIVTLFALIAASMAFSPNQLPQGEYSTLRCFPRCLKQHSHGTIAGSKDQVVIDPRWSLKNGSGFTLSRSIGDPGVGPGHLVMHWY